MTRKKELGGGEQEIKVDPDLLNDPNWNEYHRMLEMGELVDFADTDWLAFAGGELVEHRATKEELFEAIGDLKISHFITQVKPDDEPLDLPPYILDLL